MPGDTPLKLVIFDVDGTLVDSQDFIVAAMDRAFAQTGLPAPSRAETLQIVGLSLPEAMLRLMPGLEADGVEALVHHYKESFIELRRQTGGEAHAPFYPGARDAIERLDASGWLLSIATGKARRGLDHMLDSHGLRRFFIGTQTADDAPSKPHPGMVLNCLAATGVDVSRAVMVGDTEFDVAMARAAGARAIGVGWGYHDRQRLIDAGADTVIDAFDALDAALEALLEPA